MDIQVKSLKLDKIKTDVIVIPVFQDSKPMEENFQKIDAMLGKVLSKALVEDKSFAEEGQFNSFLSGKRIDVKEVILAGMGKDKKITEDKLRKFGGKLVNYLKSKNLSKVVVLSFGLGLKKVQVDRATYCLTEGLVLGGYSFDKYKSKCDSGKDKKEIKSITLLPQNDFEEKQMKKPINEAVTICNVTNIVRDLVNEPANVATPKYLADFAKKLFKKTKVKCKVLDKKAIKKLGMNLLLGVSKGSSEDPRLILLEYKGKCEKLGLVGKGVTFDAGGLNLKPSAYMDDMKEDMGGAAAVLGVFKAVADLKLSANLVGVIPCTENLCGSSAQKPGDVILTASGKTVEIANTDAEGRLILADALWYTATKLKPKKMIDIATLTGASVVTLGKIVAPIVGTDKELIDGLVTASNTSYERLWELPFYEEYLEDVKGKVADIKNLGLPKGEAGVIAGGAFLNEFVNDIPWAHIDIGGAVNSNGNGYIAKGHSGFGVRVLVEYLKG
jgi:leucyl aminopeptidase